MRAKLCQNLNHRRYDAPVRYCPSCGEVVNPKVVVKACSEREHVQSRMNRNTYCVHCGSQLIT